MKVTRSVTHTVDGVQVEHTWTIESDGDVTGVLDEVERRIVEIANLGDASDPTITESSVTAQKAWLESFREGVKS